MERNASGSSGDHFKNFVDSKIFQGRFKNESEVLRADLRLPENEENKTDILREAIKAGIESGIVESFDPKKHLALLKRKK